MTLEVCVVVATMFWCGMMLVKSIAHVAFVVKMLHESRAAVQSFAASRAEESEQTKK